MVYVFLANGFEDIEGLAPVDILRRGGVEVKTVGIMGSEYVETAHGVTLKADVKFEDIDNFDDADLLLLPGGMPGSLHLKNHKGVCDALEEQNERVNILALSVQPLWCWANSASLKVKRLHVILASRNTLMAQNIPQIW